MSKRDFRIIDGCPVPALVAPYVYLVLREAGERASSIYRGEDAKALLHRYGKRTQAEIHRALPAISNPPGFSQHELRDGQGRPLEDWQVGIDSGVDGVAAKLNRSRAAARLGFVIHHPYKKGVEGHHWQFLRRPKPRNLKQRVQILYLRATLPKR